MAITKYTATYSDGSSADFMTLEDLITHDAQPELHPDAAVLPADAGVAAPVTTEPDHATPAEEVAPASGEAQTPAEDTQQDAA